MGEQAIRCPYCGGLNPDQASFCRYCGRDLTLIANQPTQRPQQPPRPVQPAQGLPVPRTGSPTPAARQQPPHQQPRPLPPTQSLPVPRTGSQAPAMPQQQLPRTRQPDIPVAPLAPEPPAPFPPHNMDQLQMLEQGALPFTVIDTMTEGTRRKVVNIVYPNCVAWQQVATLLKAFKEQQETRFASIIIRGYLSRNPDVYAFTHGQLVFDRDVRLGGQTMNRYQIETGNGFEIDSVRIVLSE